MRSFLLAGFLAVAATLTAQTPPQATFRAGVELVTVDFLAVTADGRPIADLRPAEVTLTVDGKPRAIQDLQFIRLASEERTPRTTPPAAEAPLALPFATNRAGETGRTVIFLFDDNSIRPGNERAGRDAVARFLGKLAPADRVALATAARVEVDLTTNKERVRSALKNIIGHGAAGPDTRPTGTRIEQAGVPLAWLRIFLEGLKDVDGPKTVILLSEGIVGGASPMDYRDVAKTAGAVRAQLYVIQPHNLAIDASQTSGDVGMTSDDLKSDLTRSSDYHSSEDAKLKTLEDLSSVTGGELFRLSADAEPVFDHVVRESSAYYLLGFGPDSSERNAKSHRIAVTVSRPGVTVRARPEFTIPKAGAAAAAARKLTLPDMLKDRNTYRDVPLRAAAYAIRTSDKGINVVVAAESLDRSIAIDAAAFALIDTNFNLMTLAWPAPASALGEPRIISGGVVPPGPYRLRVAVTAKDGRRGTADYEFVAGLTKATPLEVGDLMIGQGQPDGTFLPELVIGDRAAATGYLELQGSLPVGTAISATFELAADAAGPPLASVPGIVLPTETGTRLSARGAIPIGSFAPGDYVVRAIVKVDGAIVARVMRAVRKQRDQ